MTNEAVNNVQQPKGGNAFALESPSAQDRQADIKLLTDAKLCDWHRRVVLVHTNDVPCSLQFHLQITKGRGYKMQVHLGCR